ncbi:hypothetical protein QVD17_00320 [Tagetes erecta]|uniref:Glutaredoxin domain-containing protein n=1 Tax=Tagetes erecta TaxID=13708 RepID=A0AAD8L7M7_TARER|nr:hypothetical protein QVD17_00320 [Tagetes erecta]
MWLSRKNSINTTPTSPNRKSTTFNRHSFKNIDDLFVEDEKNKNKNKSKNKNASSTANVSPTSHNKDHQKPKPKPKQKQSSPVASKKQSSPVASKKQSSPVASQKQSSPVASSTTTAKKHSVFHRVCLANQFTRSISPNRSKPNHEKSISLNRSKSHHEKITKSQSSQSSQSTNASTLHEHEHDIIPGSEERVVVYMTSLGAVRPTFDACRAVRSILQGFRVAVDERDLSMDASFKEELKNIMSPEVVKKNTLGLPRVFIGGRYVGDAEDMRQLSETGELKKLVEGLPAVSRGVCEGCGDFRFVICSDCNGSRKCYKDDKGAGVFRSCTACNKNGLVRCTTCWANLKS